MWLRGTALLRARLCARSCARSCARLCASLSAPQEPLWGRYRAVVFEESGVLLPAPHGTAAGWEAQGCVPAGTVQRALLAGGQDSPSRRYSRGELTAVEFLQELGQQCFDIANVRVPVDSFLWDLIRAEMMKQLPTLAEAARCIRAEGLQTALLSSSWSLGRGGRFLPLEPQLFDVVVESRWECAGRQDLYRLCLERLGVQPQECLVLGSSSPSLEAAAQLGMATVKVDDPEAALKELETHLGFPVRGFVPYTRSVRPGMEIPKDQLQKYLEDVLSVHPTGPLELRQFDHGEATRSYLVKFGDRLLVLKKEEEPPDSLSPPGPAVPREYRLLKALSEAGVPVPTVLALCEDSSTLGTPFFVMELCPGRVHRDVSLRALRQCQRRDWYRAMGHVLARIHSVGLEAMGLQHLEGHGNYIQQQVETWTKQYRAVESQVIPAMERLIQWLPLHFPEPQRTTLVHGDFRMEHLIFHPDRPEVLAVLGWKFAALGDPFCDLANSCMAHFLPPHFSARRGLSTCDLGQLGLPTAEEYSQMYCSQVGLERPDCWNFYMAFAFFRLAVALQGRPQRCLAGSPAPGASSPQDTELVAELAWDFAIREGFRVFDSLPSTRLLVRRCHSWAGHGPFPGRRYSTWPHTVPHQPRRCRDPEGQSEVPAPPHCTSSGRTAGPWKQNISTVQIPAPCFPRI
ncbi:acyl-CoA dehydrogenase family member 10 [Pithys albifrons albifrons]|uniref:acyl-CoA dehydrogenase family member 10 n=1 Tax=Pithys albifrons albifrons TaxID=3385563 RepID=UPI003A5CC07B